RLDLLSADRNSPNGISFAQQRCCEVGTGTGNLANDLGIGELASFNCHVVDVNSLAIPYCPTDRRSKSYGSPPPAPRWHCSICRHSLIEVTINPKDKSIFGLTQPRSILSDNVQHRLQIGRKTSDDTENLARCNLLTIARLKLFGEALYFFLELA